MNENFRLLIAILLCFSLIVAFGFFFSGLLGAFIGGFIAGLIAGRMVRGAVVAFVGGLLAATILTTLALVGVGFFDAIVIGRLMWGSLENSIVGIAILLEFLAIGLSVAGGAIGGLLSRTRGA